MDGETNVEEEVTEELEEPKLTMNLKQIQRRAEKNPKSKMAVIFKRMTEESQNEAPVGIVRKLESTVSKKKTSPSKKKSGSCYESLYKTIHS